MPDIKYATREAIVAQALKEIDFARRYKQGKTKSWQANEELYYSRVKNVDPSVSGNVIQSSVNGASRANVDLGQMASFVHSILSKIDAPLYFKFIKRKTAQLRRVDQLNALRTADQDKDDWDIKDLVGKKQVIIYGRAIYSYFAESIDGYKAHLDNIDVYDFLIDPAAGGIDIEKGMFMGDYGVVKTRDELKQGVRDGIYLKTETQRLLDGDGNSTEEPQEELNKKFRTNDQGTWNATKEIGHKDKFKFWRWGTTFEGKRYYLLLSEKGATAVEIVPLEEKFESGLWWYWTYAAFPDLTEFWTPSYCDYVRQIFLAQAVSINQMLDNAEQIVKPQKVVNVGAIENLAELKYRRDGIIKVKKDFDINRAFQTVQVPSINTPLAVYKVLDDIQQVSSGVTNGVQGAAKNGGGQKVAIYEGNQENSADRFGLLNKSYSFGYKRFAKLYEWGVREHLVKKIAIDILGPDGVEVIEVSRRDIFRKDESFNVMVESSNAETALSARDKAVKVSFLASKAALPVAPGQKPIQNPQKAYEMEASIVGFTEEEIRQLLDVDNYGDADVMSMAESDIEKILDGEKLEPNEVANTAYKQRFVDYMAEHKAEISNDQFMDLAAYVMSLDQVIMRNMIKKANNDLLKVRVGKIMAQMSMEQDPQQQQKLNPGMGSSSGMGEIKPTEAVQETPMEPLPEQPAESQPIESQL